MATVTRTDHVLGSRQGLTTLEQRFPDAFLIRCADRGRHQARAG
ncbi:MAG: hypothetical protein OEV72_06150 [Thermoleophilia bacterium]|nr:hypothetical protein [Thermoleophilia bacterium]